MARERKALRPEVPSDGGPSRVREQHYRDQGACLIAGVDEVGRGALAGPVVAAAVALDPERCPQGLNDSKLLTPAQRVALYHQILQVASAAAIHLVGPRRIDEINILRASHEAMRKAVLALGALPDVALVDGLPVPDFPCPHDAIVKGDARECAIAAASILAKVTRDALMRAYAAHYPEYGFARHKGYATSHHRTAILDHGICPIHRRTFTRSILEPAILLPLEPGSPDSSSPIPTVAAGATL